MGYLLGNNDLTAVVVVAGIAAFVLCYWIRTHYTHKYKNKIK